MANGFDDLFAEMTSINAELVLVSERLKVVEEAIAVGPQVSGGSGEKDEEEGRPVGAPVCWDDLSAEELAMLWPAFVAWVLWLADKYELVTDQLPRQCWWRHGAVVEELTALWTSHQSAYASGEDGGSAPYLWQDALARAIERIGRNWLGTCRNGQHKERHREAWSGDEKYEVLLLSLITPLKTRASYDEADDSEETGTPDSPGEATPGDDGNATDSE
ncbi:hypothetical protein [Streptomyces hygroscopicus]|uniref:hypothetical protein n=1 Tax=Streptomyces hygroscopicus TaxID=1912 RepID=UPI001FCC7686|nr:hypothetical protein [Streptomyces hygroscopicus]BDH10474.1 hypothetical protein HOK021_16530 [Streptomyces hygroscopicus]